MSEFWDITPEWSKEVREVYAWQTEIITSRSGKEQRRALRSVPRYEMKFQAIADGDRRRKLDRIMARAQNGLLQIPDFTSFVLTTESLPVSANTVNVSEIPEWLVIGAEVALVDGRHSEKRTVSDINGTAVTFSENSALPFPKASQLCPLIEGRVGSSIRSTRVTADVAIMPVDFTATPGTRMIGEGEIDFDEIYRDREIFWHVPDYSNTPRMSYDHPVETVDYSRNRDAVFSPVEFSSRTRTATYRLRNAWQAKRIVEFFNRHKGRRGEFYAPTWEPDLIPVDGVSAGDSSILVEGRDVHDSYAGSTVNTKVVFILNPMGARYAVGRSITGTSIEGGNTRLTFSRPFDFDIPVSAISMISFLTCHRFSKDDLTVRWMTDQLADITVSMTSIEDLDAEGTDFMDGAALWLLSNYGWSFVKAELVDPIEYAVNVVYPKIGGV